MKPTVTTMNLTQLFKTIANESYTRDEHPKLYNAMMRTFAVKCQFPWLEISGKLETEKDPTKYKEDQTIHFSGPLLYYEREVANTWHIIELRDREEAEEKLLDWLCNCRADARELPYSIENLLVFDHGKLQEWTVGRIREDGKRIEIDELDGIESDIQIYWEDQDISFDC